MSINDERAIVTVAKPKVPLGLDVVMMCGWLTYVDMHDCVGSICNSVWYCRKVCDQSKSSSPYYRVCSCGELQIHRHWLSSPSSPHPSRRLATAFGNL